MERIRKRRDGGRATGVPGTMATNAKRHMRPNEGRGECPRLYSSQDLFSEPMSNRSRYSTWHRVANSGHEGTEESIGNLPTRVYSIGGLCDHGTMRG